MLHTAGHFTPIEFKPSTDKPYLSTSISMLHLNRTYAHKFKFKKRIMTGSIPQI